METAVSNIQQPASLGPFNEAFDLTQQTSYDRIPAQQPLPTSLGYDFQQDPAFDDSFLTFDEFAQNVLADSSYFSYEPAPNAVGEPSNLPAVTPLGSTYISLFLQVFRCGLGFVISKPRSRVKRVH